MPLIYLSCAWIAGIFLGNHFDLPLTLLFTGLIPLSLLFFVRQRQKTLILTTLCLTVLFVAATYSYSNLHNVNESKLSFYNDLGTVQLKGMVTEDPEVRDKSTRLKLATSEIRLDNGWRAIEGTALLFVPRYPAYKYGDVLLVTGEPETPPQLDDFDYKNYLAHQGIYTTMPYPEIEMLERGMGFKPLEWVYSLRSQVAQTLARVLPEPQASLAQGIILGMRGNIPLSLKADFARTGTAHLLAISGLHLGIIAGITLSAGIWLFGRKRYLYVWLALGTIWLYALLTGMHSPIVRGAIMASLFLAAELFGRQRSAITALVFAAAIMVGVSPYILGDAAFQLSFLAMAGLVFLFPTFRTLGRNAVKAAVGEDRATASIANFASDSFGVTMAAIIAVWPVIAYYFGIISFVAPLATFLALPALPGIIMAGALTGVLGFIALPAAQVMGWLTWLFLLYIVSLIRSLATPSISSIDAGSVNTVLIWAYYVILAALIWLNSNRKKLADSLHEVTNSLRSGINSGSDFFSRLPVKWAIPPLLIIAILVSFAAVTMPDDDIHVSFLDVGEGDAILIQKGHQQVLVDGGPSPQMITLALGSQMPFWDRTIDLLVLTHPHQDHLAGLAEVMQRFRVKQVLYPALDYESPLYDEWHKLINDKNVKSTIARAGQQIDLGAGETIQVINPMLTPLTGTQSDIDNNSLVLRLNTGNISFLLTADIMKEAEFKLVADRANLRSTVLKVAHHGSATSTSQEFLAVTNPRIAVISTGENRFGHPSAQVLDRLEAKIGSEKIFRTDQHGTIEFITDGERLWVEIER